MKIIGLNVISSQIAHMYCRVGIVRIISTRTCLNVLNESAAIWEGHRKYCLGSLQAKSTQHWHDVLGLYTMKSGSGGPSSTEQRKSNSSHRANWRNGSGLQNSGDLATTVQHTAIGGWSVVVVFSPRFPSNSSRFLLILSKLWDHSVQFKLPPALPPHSDEQMARFYGSEYTLGPGVQVHIYI